MNGFKMKYFLFNQDLFIFLIIYYLNFFLQLSTNKNNETTNVLVYIKLEYMHTYIPNEINLPEDLQ